MLIVFSNKLEKFTSFDFWKKKLYALFCGVEVVQQEL
jgi:hypothetical protein